MTTSAAGGPYFDDLAIGQTYNAAPAVTLTSGLAAVQPAIIGGPARAGAGLPTVRRCHRRQYRTPRSGLGSRNRVADDRY